MTGTIPFSWGNTITGWLVGLESLPVSADGGGERIAFGA
jgi:hypothetical protein